jgi:hypothetical protein
MHPRTYLDQRRNKMRAGLALFLMITACDREQVAESNQAAVIDRAKTLERAADASVDDSIARITRESLENNSGNEGTAQ